MLLAINTINIEVKKLILFLGETKLKQLQINVKLDY